jgi:hypothetical protein
MSDPPNGEESPGTYVFPIPPDDGLLSRLSFKARATITTGEFAGALTCAAVAWSVGADMTLTIGALFAAWILGSIGIATVPAKSGPWKVLAVIGLFLVFAAEGRFLYWHFQPKAEVTVPAPPIVQAPTPIPTPAPTPTPAKPRLASTYQKMILVCDKPRSAKPQTLKERKADLAKYIDLMEKIFGYSVKGSVEQDELTLSINLSASAAGTGIQRQTYFIKQAADKIFVSITNETAGPFGIIVALAVLSPEDDTAKQIMEKVEQLVQVEPGKCKFV